MRLSEHPKQKGSFQMFGSESIGCSTLQRTHAGATIQGLGTRHARTLHSSQNHLFFLCLLLVSTNAQPEGSSAKTSCNCYWILGSCWVPAPYQPNPSATMLRHYVKQVNCFYASSGNAHGECGENGLLPGPHSVRQAVTPCWLWDLPILLH